MGGKMTKHIMPMALLALLLTVAAVSAATQFKFTAPAKYGVYIASTDTGKIRYLAGFYAWSVSPDGKWVAGDFDGTVSVVSVATGKKTILKSYRDNGPGVYPEFGWSKDSRWLRVSCDWDTDDENETPVVDVLAVQPGSENGPRPAASSVNSEAPIEKASSPKIKGYRVCEAVYSPNRRKVAALCVHGSYWESGYQGGLFLCNPNGSGTVRITKFIFKQQARNYDYRNDAEDREVRWLPNGKGILFRRTSHEDEGI